MKGFNELITLWEKPIFVLIINISVLSEEKKCELHCSLNTETLKEAKRNLHSLVDNKIKMSWTNRSILKGLLWLQLNEMSFALRFIDFAAIKLDIHIYVSVSCLKVMTYLDAQNPDLRFHSFSFYGISCLEAGKKNIINKRVIFSLI